MKEICRPLGLLCERERVRARSMVSSLSRRQLEPSRTTRSTRSAHPEPLVNESAAHSHSPVKCTPNSLWSAPESEFAEPGTRSCSHEVLAFCYSYSWLSHAAIAKQLALRNASRLTHRTTGRQTGWEVGIDAVTATAAPSAVPLSKREAQHSSLDNSHTR